MHLRIPPSLLDRVKAQAAKNRRSAAAELLVIVEEALDQPEPTVNGHASPRAPLPYQPAAEPQPPRPRTGRPQRGTPPPKVADIFYDAIQQALSQHGIDLADGRRAVLVSPHVRPIFDAHPMRQKFDNTLNREAVRQSLRKLVDEDVVRRDGDMIWMTEAAR